MARSVHSADDLICICNASNIYPFLFVFLGPSGATPSGRKSWRHTLKASSWKCTSLHRISEEVCFLVLGHSNRARCRSGGGPVTGKTQDYNSILALFECRRHAPMNFRNNVRRREGNETPNRIRGLKWKEFGGQQHQPL